MDNSVGNLLASWGPCKIRASPPLGPPSSGLFYPALLVPDMLLVRDNNDRFLKKELGFGSLLRRSSAH